MSCPKFVRVSVIGSDIFQSDNNSDNISDKNSDKNSDKKRHRRSSYRSIELKRKKKWTHETLKRRHANCMWAWTTLTLELGRIMMWAWTTITLLLIWTWTTLSLGKIYTVGLWIRSMIFFISKRRHARARCAPRACALRAQADSFQLRRLALLAQRAERSQPKLRVPLSVTFDSFTYGYLWLRCYFSDVVLRN